MSDKSRGNYGTGGWEKRQGVERCERCGHPLRVTYDNQGATDKKCTKCGKVRTFLS